jgi:hypothetical protein
MSNGINVSQLISQLEQRAAESRAKIGKTRTKLESNELKGEVYAFNEAIYMIKELVKQENGNGSADQVESVGTAAS